MIAKSAVAPLDRVKILLQAQNKYYRHLGESYDIVSQQINENQILHGISKCNNK